MDEYGSAEKRPDTDEGESDADLHAEAMADFKRAAEAEEHNRATALEDIEFARLGKQWPDKVEQDRKKDGRPCLTFNRMPAFIRQVVNDSRLNRPAIKVRPVDSGSDPKTAEILNGLIRNIEVSSQADVAYDTGIDQAASGGWGYWRVDVDYACDDTFDRDLRIERVANQFTVYGDPDSTAADSSDWNVAFVTELLSEDEFKARWPKADAASFDADGTARDEQWYQQDMLRVAEYWRRRKVPRTIYLMADGSVLDAETLQQAQDQLAELGLAVEMLQPPQQAALTVKDERQTHSYQVTQYIISGAEVLETNEWAGRYIPLVPVYGDEVIVEGKRYLRSLICDAKDPQRSYNYWRTSAVEKVALDTKAPWVGPVGSFKTERRKWLASNNTNQVFLEYDLVPNGAPPQRAYSAGVPAGDMAMTAQASDDMKAIVGIYDASLGARSNETSGVAIRQRQREGDVSTFHFIDNLARAIRHTGRILVDLIPKVYDTRRIVRVLGEDGRPAEVVPGQTAGMAPINQPVIVEGVERVFDLTTGKYDVVVETGPGFSTKREEAAAQMMELAKGSPGIMPIIGDLFAQNLDWPGADEIAKRLRNMVPPQALGQQAQQGPTPQQAQQMQQALQQMQAQLQQLTQENQQLKLQNADKSQENAIKAREAEIKAHEAETDRMRTLVEASRPPAPPRAPQQTGPEPVF
jgi:hypothetical protein